MSPDKPYSLQQTLSPERLALLGLGWKVRYISVTTSFHYAILCRCRSGSDPSWNGRKYSSHSEGMTALLATVDSTVQ